MHFCICISIVQIFVSVTALVPISRLLVLKYNPCIFITVMYVWPNLLYVWKGFVKQPIFKSFKRRILQLCINPAPDSETGTKVRGRSMLGACTTLANSIQMIIRICYVHQSQVKGFRLKLKLLCTPCLKLKHYAPLLILQSSVGDLRPLPKVFFVGKSCFEKVTNSTKKNLVGSPYTRGRTC